MKEIEIDGCVDVSGNKITDEEFVDLFLIWLEEHNWYFGGSIKEYK